MTLKNKIKREIELLYHLKSINSSNDDLAFGANIAYDVVIARLKELLK